MKRTYDIAEPGRFEARDYWVRRLRGRAEPTLLHADYGGGSGGHDGAPPIAIALPNDIVSELERQTGGSRYMLSTYAHAALVAAIFRFTGDRSPVIGCPALRSSNGESRINALPVVVDVEPSMSFEELVLRTQNQLRQAYQHQDYPYAEMLTEFGLRPEDRLFAIDMRMVDVHGPRVDVDSDLSIALEWPDDGLVALVHYRASSFDVEAVRAFGHHYVSTMAALVKRPAVPIGEVNILDEQWLICGVNPPPSAYPRRALHVQFAEVAAERPRAVAIEHGGRSISYESLDRAANQLAHRLRSRGVRRGDTVAVLVERGPDAFVSMLAVLKAGAAYLPIDPSYPAQRRGYMLSDSGAAAVIVDEQRESEVQGEAPTCPRVTVEPNVWYEGAHAPPLLGTIPATQAAYVMYTSGSTGTPKAIAVPHLSISRLVRGTDYVQLSPSDRVAQVASISFDAATFEIWGALLNGGTVVCIDRDIALSPTDFAQAIVESRITSLFLTTALFNALARYAPDTFASVNNLLFGGEFASPSTVRAVLDSAPPRRLMHVYGPTETTTFATWHLVRQIAPQMASVPIGKAIANTQVHVLNERMELVPVGAVGELYIGGPGVANGYRGRPMLTAERFVPDPFSSEVGGRLYRTGDWGRRRFDGDIDFIGRRDSQVKLRGFRIELGEIEAALRAHEAVGEAVVAVGTGASGAERLVAYTVPEVAATPAAPDELKRFLEDRLPAYMIPQSWVSLDAIPLTANGKCDRLALRELTPVSEVEATVETEPPLDAIDPVAVDTPAPSPATDVLSGIWSEVLGANWVDPNANFFELGGDSILAIQVIARAQESGLAITPRQLFENQTIASLAQAAAGSEGDGRGAIEEQASPGALSPSQRRFFENALTDPDLYNSSVLLALPADLDCEAMSEAVAAVVERHEVLRARFVVEDGAPRMCIDNEGEPLVVEYLGAIDDDEVEGELAVRLERVQRSLRIEGGPLVRFAIFLLGAERGARLLVAPHHLVMDGVSLRILIDDLAQAYNQARRGEAVDRSAPRPRFQQWWSRQAEIAESNAMADAIEYWTGPRFASAERLPRDHDGGLNTVGASATVEHWLTSEVTDELIRAARDQYRTDMRDVLMVAVCAGMRGWTGAKPTLIDVEDHGRGSLEAGRPDAVATIGWFSTRFPVLVDHQDELSLVENLRRVKNELRSIPGGSSYDAIRWLRRCDDAGVRLARMPAAEIWLNYQGDFSATGSALAALKQAEEPCGPVRSTEQRRDYLIELRAAINADGLRLHWTYSSNHHRRETIEALAARVRDSLVELARPPADTPLYAPSDFPYAAVDQTALDRIMAKMRGDGV